MWGHLHSGCRTGTQGRNQGSLPEGTVSGECWEGKLNSKVLWTRKMVRNKEASDYESGQGVMRKRREKTTSREKQKE